MKLHVPNNLIDIWQQLGPQAQAEMIARVQELFECSLQLIQRGLKARQRGGQPCAG
jgi:hypothetical protein